MANTTPTPAPASPPLKQLGFAFPFRKKGQRNAGSSADFTDEHDFHKVLKQEPSGSYSVSGKGMWHGGIHVTEAGSGGSLDLKFGVRCLADGEVVAWRINRAYPVSDMPAQNDQPAISAPYSTGFALVRHSMEFPRGTTLKFFSLYMHLQDLAGYESDTSQPKQQKPAYWSTQFKVTEFAQDKPHAGPNGQVAPTEQQGIRIRATKPHGTILGILPQGAQVSIGQRDGDWGRLKDTHGAQLIAPTAGGLVAANAGSGWIFLGKENGGSVVEEVMPDSSIDCVVVPPVPFPVKAGDLIGHLGRYDSLSQQTSNRMVHIEVFCDDSVKSFMEQGAAWVNANGAHPDRWQQLGLPGDPTILRVDKNTTLYRPAGQPGQYPQPGQGVKPTGVIQVAAFAELAKQSGNPLTETTVDADGKKRCWWHVDSADVQGNAIDGWVREQNFAGGRVTREFAQTWVDFQPPLDDAHDPAHTMFATAQAFVDYASGADVPEPAALGKLSPLMASIYRALYPTGDGSRAADDLCAAAEDPWTALRMSRLIIKHESEWANPDKWKQLIVEIEKQTGPQAQHEAEQKRIEKLVWWDDVKAGLTDLPASDVFHIHPIGLVGNFYRNANAHAISDNGLWFIFAHEAQANVTNHLHWPHGASGVTLGAGYDMKGRTPSEISTDMNSIGLPDATAQAVSHASGLQGSAASTFATTNHNLVNLTDNQQVQLLRNTIGHYENMVRNSIKVQISQNEFDALVSFAYNPAGRWQSVTNFVNNGQIECAMSKIREGNTSGGVVMSGLTNRRSDEVNLYKNNRYEFNGHPLPPR
ncbi:glycoside hydrolase family protein [Paraburkholderia gardini]|uniref:glycoside hydrolase family protein n=1 Tax=Paraburkholderia gardini TaxID=2823469 RepID=UPI001DD63BA2|nr:glycoside hydrolase family protein [Paraburkholderia gardini]CAG4895277.1 hypothetical protein R69919_01992 [Paraburkholderia gardini]